MSGKDPKKETDSKIKFFEIDELGDINPAFPDAPESSKSKVSNDETNAELPREFHEQTENSKQIEQTLNPKTISTPKFELNEISNIQNAPIHGIAPDPNFASSQLFEKEFNENEPLKQEFDQEQTNSIIKKEPDFEINQFENIDNINQSELDSTPLQTNLPSSLEDQIHKLKPEIDSMKKREGNLSEGQIDILRKYLSLKENEVRDLKDQHRQYESFLKKISSQLENYAQRNRELITENESLKSRESRIREDVRELKDRQKIELLALKSEFEERLRNSGTYDAQVEELNQKKEAFREKVKDDLRKIKLKERELENKYELLKRDMQALLDSKDRHVLELKKKTDAFELEMEALEDRLRKSSAILDAIASKKKRLIETMKLAISLLENIDHEDAGTSGEEEERKVG